MIHFRFSEQDSRYVFIKGDNEEDFKVYEKIKEYINLVDPICYLPKYQGPKFTQDFIWDYVQPLGGRILYCSIGLTQAIYNFLKENNIPFDGVESKYFKRELQHSFEEFKEIVKSWKLSLDVRPYQYEAAYKILQRYRSLSELATRAGKTLISYMIFRYAFEYLGVKKILMIVPSIDLVKQGYGDFSDYAEFFKTECIWSGGKVVESSNLTIGTFQSLIKFLDRKSKKYNPSFFNGYDCVFVDEVHRATAEEIKTIISQPFMKDIKIAYGMTGTLPKQRTIEGFCLNSLIGAKIQTIKARELMDAGYISDIDITQVRVNYKDIQKQNDLYIKCAEYALSTFITVPNKKNPKKQDKIRLQNPEFLIQFEKQFPLAAQIYKNNLYSRNDLNDAQKNDEYVKFLKNMVKNSDVTNALVVERMMVHFMTERIEFLCNRILVNCKYNTLVLAHHTEYIKYIVDYVTEHMPEKIVCCITGATKGKERDAIKETLKNNNNCVLIASYGCVGTGITLSNLCFGVLFESFKSGIINMQSLGRGLGLSKFKNKYVVYDFIDVFDSKYSNKSLYRQGLEKIKLYNENQYANKIVNVTI